MEDFLKTIKSYLEIVKNTAEETSVTEVTHPIKIRTSLLGLCS